MRNNEGRVCDGDRRRPNSPLGNRAAEQPVASAAEAELAFDEITYDKGAAVIGMLEDYVGADRFRDVGIDAQYQYITDRHRFSTQLNWISERQDLDATFGAGAASNPSDRLRTFKGKVTYYYDTKYGATLAYFRASGDEDVSLYNTRASVTGSATGSPKTSGYVFEVNWLPRRDVRLLLQYTAYRDFNGSRTNYDGFGRNAKDNNTLFLMGWIMI